MKSYINSLFTDMTVRRELKEIIPDMTLRRRMSAVVRMGVSAGMESLNDFGMEVDAIITATGLGCLADSEKFLYNTISEKEQMLNPTPFIQSTFNIVGAQIAVLTKNHGYNMTYVHRSLSFESALMDAMMRLDESQGKAVLVGSVDEVTDTSEEIMARMGLLRRQRATQGACFFVLTAEPTPHSVAEIIDLEFFGENVTKEEIGLQNAGCELLFTDDSDGFNLTKSALYIAQGLEILKKGVCRVVVVNRSNERNLAKFALTSLSNPRL